MNHQHILMSISRKMAEKRRNKQHLTDECECQEEEEEGKKKRQVLMEQYSI
jgi:hypothetical protein